MAEKHKKIFEGSVVSDKIDNVVVVEVTTLKFHPLYRKRIKWTKRYFVHDEKNQCRVGDTIAFTPSRPFSRRTKFNLEKILTAVSTSEKPIA